MEVVEVCTITEKRIRKLLMLTDNKVPNDNYFLHTFVYTLAGELYQKQILLNLQHEETTSILKNHSFILIKMIIFSYCKIRFNSLSKKYSTQIRGDILRKTLSKLIIFNHQ